MSNLAQPARRGREAAWPPAQTVPAPRGVALDSPAALAWFAAMPPVDHKTMFEIYRETDYNRAFRFVFFTDLDEHNRGKEIARAAAGETVFSGFITDERKSAAREAIEGIVDDLNAMDGDDACLSPAEFQARLGQFLVP
jgi:hypothetical protein